MAEIVSLSMILVVTTIVVMILRLAKQPPVISYIIAGFILGPSVLGLTFGVTFVETFSSLGIAFLLFIVGISLNWRGLRNVGVAAVVTGLGQVIFTSGIGFLIGKALGFTNVESIYIAVALTFSSTIIIVKLLTDKKDLETLYGKISVGVLLVQDLIAVFALLFISSMSTGSQAILPTLAWTVVKGGMAFLIAWGINVYLLPGLLRAAGKSQEVLFLFSVAWCFAFAAFFDLLGFSLEIGALVAGLTLASTKYSYEIASRVKILRDFFIILFFIVLGGQMNIGSLHELIIPAVVLSIFILIGNPLIVLFLMGWMGFSRKTAFKTGLTVAQISEFSLILITLGVGFRHLSTEILSMVTLVGLITITGSTYLIMYSAGIYNRIKKYIPYYQRGVHKHEHKITELIEAHQVILFGHNRSGYSVVQNLLNKKTKFLIVDFNPEVVFELQQKGYYAILGDADDAELYEEIRMDKAKIVVSTISDYTTNSLILSKVRSMNKKAATILTATQVDDALLLYEQGADYVIIPHIVGGDHAAIMLDAIHTDINSFIGKKEMHIKQLKNRRIQHTDTHKKGAHIPPHHGTSHSTHKRGSSPSRKGRNNRKPPRRSRKTTRKK